MIRQVHVFQPQPIGLSALQRLAGNIRHAIQRLPRIDDQLIIQTIERLHARIEARFRRMEKEYRAVKG